DERIHDLQGVDPIIISGRPLFLCSKNFMRLGIRINGPSRHLRAKMINVLMDFRHSPIELQNMSQGKSSAEISSGRRIGDVLTPNHLLNDHIFPEGFQVIQEIAADKRISSE